ncbi:MAG: WbqC family protein [Proteobacteria bacterium]|nr:WbqC family protein [Pseudomonadota bacterium]
MIISINQPAYLPWLGYFNRILKSDLHIVLNHVQFEKNSFTNRNKILLNEKPLWLTIPLLTKGNFQNLAINSLTIDPKINWKKKHWLTLEQAYSKQENWMTFRDDLRELYSLNSYNFFEILKTFLVYFLDYFGIEKKILFSSDYTFQEKKSDLILEICKKFGATKYISGQFGKDYLELNKFHDHGIEVIFDTYKHPQYPQKSEEFIPYLSCIDLMANCGKQSLKVLSDG